MSGSVAKTLEQKFNAFMSTPKGRNYAVNAENFPYNKIVLRCIDPRLNPILQALGLQGDHVISIPNAGPVLPAYGEAQGRDVQASFELFAASPHIKEICVVTHSPTCKYCGAIIHGIEETDENRHLCRYVNDSRRWLSPIEQKWGPLHSKVDSQLPMQLGQLNRANMYAYPVMKRRADVTVYSILITFDPLSIWLCQPGEYEQYYRCIGSSEA